MAFEWKELTGELPAYAYNLLNEVSYSPSFRLKKSNFEPMGFKTPSCRTYKITRKIIPKTNWDLKKSEYYKLAANVVYSAYDQYWNDHYGDDYWVGCGPVVADLVFRYWGFVNSDYGRCLPGDDYELLEKIHEKANTSVDGETTVFDLAEGIEKTAKYYGMKFIAEIAVGSASFFEDEVDSNRMAIMLVQDDPEWGDHFVAVYGYEVEHRWETCCHTDSICPDHHYVRVISGWPTGNNDIEIAMRSVGSWFSSIINETGGIQVIPWKPCSSGGGGGGGGGCSMGNLNIMSGIFVIVVFAFIMFKRRYKKCSTRRDC